VRILVTNDDGVRSPGIAALAGAAAAGGHEVIVVAPDVDYSGSGAAVGPVHSRDGIDYESYDIGSHPRVPAYGIDGPPALAVILGCIGAFGQPPDLVLSGINHGVNVGRSAMHSGTVGAALTGAHFGLRCLAVSIKYGDEPVPWETPASLAAALVEVLENAPPGTTLNLNVPNVQLEKLRGIKQGRLARSGTIRSAIHDSGRSDHPHVALPPFPSGTLRLDLVAPGSDRDVGHDTDAGLVAHGFASLTAIVGVRDAGGETEATVEAALEAICEAVDLDRAAEVPEGEAEEDLATG
jgi:5'-nucleotidase